MALHATLVGIAYLAGSLSCAVIVCRLLGLGDPRGVGSGNPGATNVLRYFGRRAAAITLAGDVLKGLVPVGAAQALSFPPAAVAAVGLAAFLGHLYPVFFGFRGGKGVATLIGVLIAMAWPVGLAFIAVWLIVAAVFRYSSLSALVAAALSPVAAWALAYPPSITAATAVMAALLIVRHRSNIANLVGGREEKIAARDGGGE